MPFVVGPFGPEVCVEVYRRRIPIENMKIDPLDALRSRLGCDPSKYKLTEAVSTTLFGHVKILQKESTLAAKSRETRVKDSVTYRLTLAGCDQTVNKGMPGKHYFAKFFLGDRNAFQAANVKKREGNMVKFLGRAVRITSSPRW